MVSNWCLCGEVVLRLMWPRYPRSVWPVASIFFPKLNSSLLDICEGSHLLSVANSFGLRSSWRITPTFGRKNVWLGNLWRITSTFRPKWFWRPPLRPENLWRITSIFVAKLWPQIFATNSIFFRHKYFFGRWGADSGRCCFEKVCEQPIKLSVFLKDFFASKQ